MLLFLDIIKNLSDVKVAFSKHRIHFTYFHEDFCSLLGNFAVIGNFHFTI